MKQKVRWTAVIKAWAVPIGLYLCSRYFGEFSSQQSTFLAIVGWIGYGLYEKLRDSQQPAKAFSPFIVSIYPNWYELLSDFKLISSLEEWHRLCDAKAEMPKAEYNVLRSGFGFTVIRPPSEDGTPPGLTFWDNRQRFITELDLSESIVESERESGKSEHRFFKHPQWGNLPELYIKFGGTGYELGLDVQQDWWKDLCQKEETGELAKLKQHIDYLCGTTRVVIAILPYSEFDIYYKQIDYEQIKAQHEASTKELEGSGWKRKAEREDAEISDPWWRIEHKYFAVAHRPI